LLSGRLFFGNRHTPVQARRQRREQPLGENNMSQTEHGTIKWFDARKGYGFIQRDNGEDVFAHANEMADPAERLPEDNERFAFEVVQGQKGPAAKNMRRLSE
jgi:CspA family cold shock protein